MIKAAFVTYRQVGKGEIADGWHCKDNRLALVLQGRAFELDFEEQKKQIFLLWNKLRPEIHNLDHVVIYLGPKGATEIVIALATEFDAAKVTFVICECGHEENFQTIAAAGLGDAHIYEKDCGGELGMEWVYDHFMETGDIDAECVASGYYPSCFK